MTGSRRADLDAPEGVDEVGEPLEVEDDDVVDLDAEEVLDGLPLQAGAAEREGGVDLVRSLAGDLGEGVARDRELLEGAAAGADEHQRVGADGQAVVGVDRSVGCRLGALGLGRVAVLVGDPLRAHVRAHHEDGLAAGHHQGEAAEPLPGGVVELALLDLRRDDEEDEAEQEPGAQRQRRPLDDAAPQRPLAGIAATAVAAAEAVAEPAEVGGPGALEPAPGFVDRVPGALVRIRLAAPGRRRPAGPGFLLGWLLCPAAPTAASRSPSVDVVFGTLRALGVAVGHQPPLLPDGPADPPARERLQLSGAEAIGVDLGGTKMLVGVVSAAGEVVHRRVIGSGGLDSEELLEALRLQLQEAIEARPGLPRSASASPAPSTASAASA